MTRRDDAETNVTAHCVVMTGETAARPASLIRRSLSAVWRQLPAALQRRLAPGVEALQQQLWRARLRRVWQPGIRGSEAVSVIGFHSAVLGLGEGARLQAQAWRAAGFDVEAVDVGALLDPASPRVLPVPGAGRTVISHLNPPELLRFLALTGGRAISGHRHIGYWAWELPTAPRAWRRAFDFVDEVWVPSRFVADALERLPGPRPPIRVVPHPVHCLPRSALTAPIDAASVTHTPTLHVLSALDLRSSLARKNVDGLLTITHAIHDRLPGRVRSTIKLAGGHAEPALLAQCLARLDERPAVRVLHQDLSETAMQALIDDCDIVLSPHRAEGFGLLLAHGMHAGKLVIATGWSGNVDFMGDDATVLLDSRLVPVRDPSGRYGGSVWAEPDLGAAVRAIERAVEDPHWLARTRALAPARLATALGGATWAARSHAWLTGRGDEQTSGNGILDTLAIRPRERDSETVTPC